MIKEMAFVYSLSCEGYIFYIGCTQRLSKRYKEHLAGDACCSSYNKIIELKEAGKLIKLIVIHYLPITEAKSKELELIQLLTSAGQNLVNGIGNKFNYNTGWKWDKLPLNIANNTMYKYNFNWWHSDIDKDSLHFPHKKLKDLYE